MSVTLRAAQVQFVNKRGSQGCLACAHFRKKGKSSATRKVQKDASELKGSDAEVDQKAAELPFCMSDLLR
jgi:hypothetical protein